MASLMHEVLRRKPVPTMSAETGADADDADDGVAMVGARRAGGGRRSRAGSRR